MEDIVEGVANLVEDILERSDMCSYSPYTFDIIIGLSCNCSAAAVEGSLGIGFVCCFTSLVRAVLLGHSLLTLTVYLGLNKLNSEPDTSQVASFSSSSFRTI